MGIFTWADGATYEGHWQHGHKHGIGLYRPVSEHADRRSLAPPPSSRPPELATGAVTAGELQMAVCDALSSAACDGQPVPS